MKAKLTIAYKLCTLLLIFISSTSSLFAKANSNSDKYIDDLSISGSISHTETFCGSCNGNVDLMVTGGQLPYTYNWSTGQTTEDLENICLGFYEVTVSDATGCTYMGNVFVGETTYWDAILETQSDVYDYIDTYDGCPDVPGTLRIGKNPGSGNSDITDISGLSFLTNVGSSLLVFQNPNLSSLNGLQNITSIGSLLSLNTNNNLIDLQGFPTIVSAPGALFIDNHNSLTSLDGIEQLTTVGNEIYIANNQSLVDISGLSTLTNIGDKLDIRICTQLTNLNGLEQLSTIGGDLILSQNFMLNDISALDHTIGIGGNLTILDTDLTACSIEPICAMLNNGAGSVIADNNTGCNSSAEILNSCGVPTILLEITGGGPVLCFGACDGFLTVEASGDNPPFNYQWSDGQTTPTATNLCPGPYQLTVTDSEGFTNSTTIQVTEPEPIMIATSISSAACFGSCDGEVFVTVAGGTGPYSYEVPTELCEGDHTVTVTDTNGCSAALSFNMPGTIPFDVTVDDIVDASGGLQNGLINITVTDGTSPFTYDWELDGSSFSTDEDLIDLGGGDYSLIVTDAEGCTQSFGPYMVGGSVSVEGLSPKAMVDLFPNPASEGIAVHFENIEQDEVRFSVLDLSGRVMKEGWLSPKSALGNYIDLDGAAAGMYFLKLQIEVEVLTRKFIVVE